MIFYIIVSVLYILLLLFLLRGKTIPKQLAGLMLASSSYQFDNRQDMGKIYLFFGFLTYFILFIIGVIQLFVPNGSLLFFYSNLLILILLTFFFIRFFLNPFGKYIAEISNLFKQQQGKLSDNSTFLSLILGKQRNEMKYEINNEIYRLDGNLREFEEGVNVTRSDLRHICFLFFGIHLLVFILISAKLVLQGVSQDIFNITNLDASSNYVNSLYFVVSTISTVGFGDLHPSNDLAQLMSVVLVFNMLFIVYILFNVLNRSVDKIARMSNEALVTSFEQKRRELVGILNIVENDQFKSESAKSFLKSLSEDESYKNKIDSL